MPGCGVGAGVGSTVSFTATAGAGASSGSSTTATSFTSASGRGRGVRRGVFTASRFPRSVPLGAFRGPPSMAETTAVWGGRAFAASWRSRSRSAVMPPCARSPPQASIPTATTIPAATLARRPRMFLCRTAPPITAACASDPRRRATDTAGQSNCWAISSWWTVPSDREHLLSRARLFSGTGSLRKCPPCETPPTFHHSA